MKTILFTPMIRRSLARYCASALLLVALAACGNGPVSPSCRLLLPELPEHWNEMLGPPHWRLEWIGSDGLWLERELSPGQMPPELSFMPEWSTPVLAWPFWPVRELLPGMMRPAGALFPWDAVSGDKLAISWEGGVDALFWKELALADRSSGAAERRLPWYFDWPRFRELLKSENMPVREDPWLADWRSIAERTVLSGFDRRRIVPRGFTGLEVPGLGGRWTGSSPFAPPLDAPPDGPLSINIGDVVDTWVSSGGLLKASSSGWVWRAWP